MKTADLDYPYPEELVATEPKEPCRILYTGGGTSKEITWPDLENLFQPGDLLVRNQSLVEKRRVFTETGLEILFIEEVESALWQVLFPARALKIGAEINLPGGITARLVKKGLPQLLQIQGGALGADYFETHGELALPPYIQAARGERHNVRDDDSWYQTQWAKDPGSVASPTASLHFRADFFERLEAKGVGVAAVTLHVGIGTFLPVRADELSDHLMHKEWVEVPKDTRKKVTECRESGGRVWALGSTVVRALESPISTGATDLFIQPGYDWKCVSGLLTNFHQPKTTLLAMVAAFSGLETMQRAYALAVEKRFRLFSYGDLSVWIR